jgi:carbamoylphosphate synthase large subunit
MKVLILGTSYPQIEALRYLKSSGYITYACSNIETKVKDDSIDYFYLIDIRNEKDLIDLIIQKKINIIHSVGSDFAMPIISSISEKLNLPHFIPKDIAITCNNKGLMRKRLGSYFKGNIPYQLIEEINELNSFKYPCIIKPVDSQGQRGVRFIKDFSDLKQKFDETKKFSHLGKIIIEEYLPGDEFSANAYFIDGELVLCIISDRIVWNEFEGGLVHKHILPSQKLDQAIESDVKNLLAEISKKLNINNGPLYLQFKLKDNMPYVIEIAPRLDGCHLWRLIKEYCNVDLIKLTFEHLLENKTAELIKYNPNDLVYELNFICDFPNELVNYSKFNIPNNVITNVRYYKEGDRIRPINNQYEKIGFYVVKSRG